MKNNCLLIFIFLIILSSCKKTLKEEKIAFPNFKNVKEVKLKGEEILEDDLAALGIYTTGKYLLTRQENSYHHHFRVYDKNTLSFLSDFGAKEGPESFIFAWYFNQFETSANGEEKIWLFEPPSGKLSLVNLTDYISHNKFNIEKSITTDPKEAPFNFLFVVNDSTIIGDSGYIDPNRVRIRKRNINNNNQEVVKLFPQVKNLNHLSSSKQYSLYHSSMGIKDTIIVSAMEHFNRLDLFSTNKKTKRIFSIVEKDDYNSKKDAMKFIQGTDGDILGKLQDYYTGLCIGEKYIYALYYNQIGENYGNPKSVEIRVFEWKSYKPKWTLKIDEYISSIAIDEENKTLYAISNEEEKILKYDIKQIL